MTNIIIILILLADVLVLYRQRENHVFLIFNITILYFNYSILIGEYLSKSLEPLVSGLYSTSFGNIYTVGLYLFFLSDLIRCFVQYKIKRLEYVFPNKPNKLNFFVLYTILLYIGLFCINREVSSSYEVKISPLYEYSVIFFCLLIYFKPNDKYNILIFILFLFFVIQDLFYGGRITSLQLMILYATSSLKQVISLRSILIAFPLGILLMTFVSIYRHNYSAVGLGVVILNIINTGFALDTAYYAYWASMTHIFASYYDSFEVGLNSLLPFILSIFFGNSLATALLNVDVNAAKLSYVSSYYHANQGGGMFFSWYYYWFGTIGMMLMVYLKFSFFNLSNRKSDICKLIFVVMVATSPRWYLYSPLVFFRGSFILLPIFYWTFVHLLKVRIR